MAFGALQRKSSNPQPFRPATTFSRSHALLRRRLKTGGLIAAVMVTLWMIVHLFSGSGGSSRSSSRTNVDIQLGPAPEGTPEVVIVTVMDPSMKDSYIRKMKENREDYAQRHGYKVFYAESSQYDLGKAPSSWALVPALRHAMTLFPHSKYFFSLSPHALVMNPELSLQEHVVNKARIEELMLKDVPVVPPDSVIHTFSHLGGNDIDLVLTQDHEGLNQESFILRQSEWAKFFLDVWFDPMYRSYNFQKAEGHALEHIIQWHPTILTRLALIPQRIINSYTVDIPSRGGKLMTYQENDFIVRAVGCERDLANRECEREMDPWFSRWRSIYGPASPRAAAA